MSKNRAMNNGFINPSGSPKEFRRAGKRLLDWLSARGMPKGHPGALDALCSAFGVEGWNTMSALLKQLGAGNQANTDYAAPCGKGLSIRCRQDMDSTLLSPLFPKQLENDKGKSMKPVEFTPPIEFTYDRDDDQTRQTHLSTPADNLSTWSDSVQVALIRKPSTIILDEFWTPSPSLLGEHEMAAAVRLAMADHAVVLTKSWTDVRSAVEGLVDAMRTVPCTILALDLLRCLHVITCERSVPCGDGQALVMETFTFTEAAVHRLIGMPISGWSSAVEGMMMLPVSERKRLGLKSETFQENAASVSR